MSNNYSGRNYDNKRRNRSRSRDRNEYRSNQQNTHGRYESDSRKERGNSDQRNESRYDYPKGSGSDGYSHTRGHSDSVDYSTDHLQSSKYQQNQQNSRHQPSGNLNIDTKTVMIKGLPSHTTEPVLYHVLAAYYPKEIRLIAQKDTGDCKGFAFVEFHSAEYAQYFMQCFAGSAGDPNAPQLIVENRAVVLDYAKDRNPLDRNPNTTSSVATKAADWACSKCQCLNFARRNECFKCSTPKTEDCAIVTGNTLGYGSDHLNVAMKADWICSKCQCQNFAKRHECFKCLAPRSEDCITVSVNQTPDSDQITNAIVSTSTANCFLAVRGLGSLTTEDQVNELFRQYAAVKNVIILRDKFTGVSRGLAFVEFHTVEHASYALQSSEATQLLSSDGTPLKISYARESFMTQQISMMHEHTLQQHVSAPMMLYNSYALPVAGATGATATWGLLPNTSASYPPVAVTSHTATLQSASTYPVDTITDPIIAKTKFPPNFEVYGAAYVFQASTGMFLDQVTEFYYCPKSKLYYNSKDGIYYKYIFNPPGSNNTCPFVRFQPPLPSSAETITVGTTNESTVASGSTAGGSSSSMNASDLASLVRQPVIISLGGANSLKNKASGSSAAVSATSINKKVLNNFMKWESANSSEAGDDAKASTASGEEIATATNQESAFGKPAPRSVQTASTAAVCAISSDKSAATFTAAGIPVLPSVEVAVAIDSVTTAVASVPPDVATAPSVSGMGAVCLLCRRQFASAEQLLRHEKESKLHAENLAKLASADSMEGKPSLTGTGEASSTGQQYRDRASERREAQGTINTSVLAAAGIILNEDLQSADEKARKRAHSNANDVNSDFNSKYAPPPTSAAVAPALIDDVDNPGNQLLRKMGWSQGGLGKEGSGIEEPVEAVGVLAGSKAGIGNVATTTGAGSVYSGEGKEYRENLRKAARSRYDQINS